MFLLDWLFGKHHGKAIGTSAPASASVPEPAHSMEDSESFAPGTTIRYSAELVARLVRDHRLMLERFGAIRTVRSTQSTIALETIKEHWALPIDPAPRRERVRG